MPMEPKTKQELVDDIKNSSVKNRWTENPESRGILYLQRIAKSLKIPTEHDSSIPRTGRLRSASVGSSKASGLLDTIKSIHKDPAEINREREKAVIIGTRPDNSNRIAQRKYDRAAQNLDAAIWKNPPKPHELPPIEVLPAPAPFVPKGVLDKTMKLPLHTKTTDNTRGFHWEQLYRKGIAEGGLSVASRPYDPYLGQTIAPISPEEIRAEEMNRYLNPFTNEKLINQENDIEDRILEAGEMPGAVQSADPYMAELSKNPAQMHKELLGPQEEAQLASIREESNKDLYDKLLPELKRKYMVPGMKRSGHLNKEIGDLIERHTKGREHAINQAMTQNRLGTLGVSQKHAALQGQGAQLSAANALNDITGARNTAEALNKAQIQNLGTREKYIGKEEGTGIKKREIKQRQFNEDRLRHEEAVAHPQHQLGVASAIINGLNPTQYINQSKYDALINPKTGENANSKLGNALAGAAGQILKAKTGGLIKKRCNKADGGQIMKDAVNNAVIDRDDPLTALRRLMNRQRLMDQSQTNTTKRRYRDGGQVNPIKAGAAQARELLGEKDLRAHIESQKTPYEKPMMASLIDGFMRGYASDGGKTGFSGPARAWTEGATIRDTTNKQNREQKSKAFYDTYNLDKDVKKEEAALRKEAFEERKLAAEIALRNATLGQTNEFRNATLAHQRDVLAQKGLGKPQKLSRADNDIISSSTKTLTAAPDLLDDLARLKELSKKLKTGTWRGKIAGEDPYYLAKAGVGEMADINEYIKLSNGLATKAGAVFGARAGAAIVKLFREEKPNIEMDQAAIQNIITKMEEQTKRAVDRGYYIQDSFEEGILPSKAVVDFDKKLKVERDVQEKLKAAEKEKYNLGAKKLAPATPSKEEILPSYQHDLSAPKETLPASSARPTQSYLGSDQSAASMRPALAPAPEQTNENQNDWDTPAAGTNVAPDRQAQIASLLSDKEQLEKLKAGL
jgi:hypothetical protein